MDESEGDFREVAFFVFQNWQKTVVKHAPFSLFCATTEPSLFATPHGIFGDFCIFRIRDFKRCQKALDGWQKVRVPGNRKSAKIGGEFEVLPRPAGCQAIFLLPQNPKKIKKTKRES